MHKPHKPQHFQTYHQSGLKGEPSIAQVEEVFQRVAKQVHHHHVAVTLFSNVENVWDVYLFTYLLAFCQVNNELRLEEELGTLYTCALDL